MGSRQANAGLQMAIVVSATFLGFLGIGAILPVLGPHVRRDLGQSDIVLGFAIGVFSIVALAGRLISGPITDRRGRKYSYTAGLALCSLAGVAYLLPFGIWAVFAGRILQGVGEAFLFTGAAAWIVELGGSGPSGTIARLVELRDLGWHQRGPGDRAIARRIRLGCLDAGSHAAARHSGASLGAGTLRAASTARAYVLDPSRGSTARTRTGLR
jgi:hypothetical protein